MCNALPQCAATRRVVHLLGFVLTLLILYHANSVELRVLSAFVVRASQDVAVVRRTPPPEHAAVAEMAIANQTPLHEDAAPFAVAVFVQLTDQALWPHIRECVGNVLAGAANISQRGDRFRRNVDVYIGMLNSNSTISDDARLLLQEWDAGARFQTRLVMHDSLPNKGLDIGLFLQQLQQVNDPAQYDVLLKVHSKSSKRLRCQMLTSLCGSSEQVRQILDGFDYQSKLGFVGPWALTWTPNTNRYKDAYNRWEAGWDKWSVRAHMRNVWTFIYNDTVEFPYEYHFLIAYGNMFWVRSAPLLQNTRLHDAVPRWLSVWTDSNVTIFNSSGRDSDWQDVVGLERVLPTLVASEYGLLAAEAPNKHFIDSDRHACYTWGCMSTCTSTTSIPESCPCIKWGPKGHCRRWATAGGGPQGHCWTRP